MKLIDALDGSVQSQRIKISARDWLDIGSAEWAKTPHAVKAAAYQAAKITGWTDAGLKNVMLKSWGPRIDEPMADYVLNLLSEWSKEYPLEAEIVNEIKAAKTEIKHKE